MLRHLKWLFAVFVVCGGIVIFAFSAGVGVSAERGGVPQYATMIAIVVSLMMFYGFILGLRSRFALASESDGETFYYLGFIYTLATLVATFTPLLSVGSVNSKQVLGYFGLGLITTFVGLAGRIFFMSDGSVVEGEEELQRFTNALQDAGRNIETVTLQISRAADSLAIDSCISNVLFEA